MPAGVFMLGGVQVSPDGRRIATGHNDGSVSVWDVPLKP